LPWSEFDLEAAEDLRVVLLEIVLHDVDRTRLERERALERQAVLMAELDHRVKNALGMIQALVRASATEGSSVQDFAVALERRIQAMALAHSLLAGERWEGASLRRLITEEIALLAHDVPTRVDLAGDDVTLTPFEALSLSLVVHELVTNAIKYGAFSSGGGTVSIGWSVAKDPSRLLLSWIERGGPAPAAAKPGFGMTLIQRTVQYELQGTANLVIEPTGIRWDLVVPMPGAAP
jgi:two-component sensor histidine kinase